MKWVITLVCVAMLAVPAFGGTQIEEAEQLEQVVVGASKFQYIYGMIREAGYPNGVGHTMAAGVLASCTGKTDGLVLVSMFLQIMSSFENRKISLPIVAQGVVQKAPQISYAAAVLACKQDGRSADEMTIRLTAIFKALVEDGLAISLHNAVVAATLVK